MTDILELIWTEGETQPGALIPRPYLFAETDFGRYELDRDWSGDPLRGWALRTPDEDRTAFIYTEDEARALAQMDYARRQESRTKVLERFIPFFRGLGRV